MTEAIVASELPELARQAADWLAHEVSTVPSEVRAVSAMASVLDWIYGLAEPFVWHPGRAMVVALVLALVGYGFRRQGGRAPFVATAAWAIFALLEFSAWREHADIRVDLLVTWPVLCLVTVVCLLVWARRLLPCCGRR